MIRAAILPISSAFESGPKPAIASGALKSQSYSASPTKFLMLGSEAQVRRSAARVNSDGTPGARNARMSVSAVIDSIGGRLAGSNASSAGVVIGPPTPSPLAGKGWGSGGCGDALPRFPPCTPSSRGGEGGVFAAAGGDCAPASVSRNTARLRRDQRDRKVSGYFIDPGLSRSVGGAPKFPDQRGRVHA